MRVLVVSHTYMVRINRDKLYELARHDDVEVYLITPKKVGHRDASSGIKTV